MLYKLFENPLYKRYRIRQGRTGHYKRQDAADPLRGRMGIDGKKPVGLAALGEGYDAFVYKRGGSRVLEVFPQERVRGAHGGIQDGGGR